MNKALDLNDILALQDFSKKSTLAYAMVRKLMPNSWQDALVPFMRTLKKKSAERETGTTVATIRMVADVDELVELPEDKRNNIKLLILAASYQMTHPMG